MDEELRNHILKTLKNKHVKVERNNGHWFKAELEGVSGDFFLFKDGIITSLVHVDEIKSIIERQDHQNKDGGSQ
jgi:hypothetical protein